MKKSFRLLLILFLETLIFAQNTYSAVDQILNSNFFLNPAELCLIREAQLTIGNVFVKSKLQFRGITTLGSGTTISKVNDSLPYVLTAYRFSDKFVAGLTITPSAYGHIEWPTNSFINEITTKTKIFYYRVGAQSSYQVTDKLALGLGANLDYDKRAELDFVIPNKGNQINRIHGLNYVGDLGVFFKINSRNYLTALFYTQLNTFGSGTSTLGTTVVNNFSLSLVQAAVASIGLQHWLNDNWFVEGKVYWSGWSIQKKIVFRNTTTGNSVSPTLWSDTLSFQINTRLATNDKLAILSSFTYETNPVPIFTNNIGYPVSPVSSLATGLDITLQKGVSTQLLYSYGAFTPKAKINNSKSFGSVVGKFQGIALQMIFKA